MDLLNLERRKQLEAILSGFGAVLIVLGIVTFLAYGWYGAIEFRNVFAEMLMSSVTLGLGVISIALSVWSKDDRA